MKKIGISLLFTLIALVGCNQEESVDLKEVIDSKESFSDYYGEKVNVLGNPLLVEVVDGKTVVGYLGVKGNHIFFEFDEVLDIEAGEHIKSEGVLMAEEDYDELFNAVIVEGESAEVVEKKETGKEE